MVANNPLHFPNKSFTTNGRHKINGFSHSTNIWAKSLKRPSNLKYSKNKKNLLNEGKDSKYLPGKKNVYQQFILMTKNVTYTR